MSSWTFRPPWWATAATLILVPCLAGLGVWQLQRGAAREALQARHERAQQQRPQLLGAGSVADPHGVVRAQVRGRFDASRQMLLDNQSQDRKPGYHVLTPLILPDGGMLIVDRGWIPQAGRDGLPELPAPESELDLEGLWRSLPVPPIRLAVDNCAAQQSWPRVVQYPTLADLRCLYGGAVADGLLLMDPGSPGGYVRQWQPGAEMSPAKNYGYAAQWFAFALTLLGIYIKLNLRRKP